MVFVADEIPPELQRIVEFLNSQMTLSDVLAVEVKQFRRDSLQTLVPRVIGQTAEAQVLKGTAGGSWNQDKFIEVMGERQGADLAILSRTVMDWTQSRGWQPTWGRGSVNGSFMPVYTYKSASFWPFYLQTNGLVQMQFAHLRTIAPFGRVEIRLELVQRLNSINDIKLSEEVLDRYPSFSMRALIPPTALKSFQETMEWAEAIFRTQQETKPLKIDQ